MLAPIRDSMRRSGASLSGSRSSLPTYSSANPSRRSFVNKENYYDGSQFSLTWTAMKNGPCQSSSHSLRQQLLYQYQNEQQPSSQNATWDNGDLNSVSKPPSLAISETSTVQTEHSSGSSSCQSSLQPPLIPPTNFTRDEVMQKVYAMRRASLQRQRCNPESRDESHRLSAYRRSSGQEQKVNHSIPVGPPKKSFLTQPQIKEEDLLWGQFVDVSSAEDDAARRRRLLSITRGQLHRR